MLTLQGLTNTSSNCWARKPSTKMSRDKGHTSQSNSRAKSANYAAGQHLLVRRPLPQIVSSKVTREARSQVPKIVPVKRQKPWLPSSLLPTSDDENEMLSYRNATIRIVTEAPGGLGFML